MNLEKNKAGYHKNIDPMEAFILRFKHDLSLNEIANRLGCSKSNVHNVLQRIIKMLPNREEIEVYRRNKTEILEACELKILQAVINDSKIKGASLNNAAYAFQQLFNAGRLTRGEATHIVDIAKSEEEIRQIDAEIAALERSG